MDDLFFDLSIWAGLFSSLYPLITDITQEYAIQCAVDVDLLSQKQNFLDSLDETLLAIVHGAIVPLVDSLLPVTQQNLSDENTNKLVVKYNPFALRTSFGQLVHVDDAMRAALYPGDLLESAKLGDSITAIGRVYRSSDQSLHIGPSMALHRQHWPFILSTLSRNQLLGTVSNRFIFILNATAAIIFAMIASIRLYRYAKWTFGNLRFLVERVKLYFSSGRTNLTDSPCVLCKQRRRDIIFFPCEHLSVCEQCRPNLANCPICGWRTYAYLRIFLA